MSEDEDDDPPPQPQKPPTRGGWRRSLRRFAVLVGVIAVVWMVARMQVNRVGERRLREVVQRLDAADPRWALAGIEVERAARAPAPDNNSAAVLDSVGALIPEEWDEWRRQSGGRWDSVPSNRLPPAKWLKRLAPHAEATLPARRLALTLRNFPRGHRPFEPTLNPITITLPHLDATLRVVTLLENDALLACLDRDPDRAVAAAHAALNAARSIGDEPTLLSQLFRRWGRARAAEIATHTLAWSAPTRGLAELQAALLDEAEEQLFLTGLRGERANMHRTFRALEEGRLDLADILLPEEHAAVGPVLLSAYRPLIPGDHAEFLRLATAYIEAAKLPWHEQLPALRAVAPGGPSRNVGHVLTRFFLRGCEHFGVTSLRNRATLLTAAVGIACERFRLRNGRWPERLEELTPAFLPALPVSPFDGRPLRYQHLPDGVAVSCFIADERRDDAQCPAAFREGNALGFAEGARLWNPEARGLPAGEANGGELP